jgi:hypothetical protein
VRTRIGAETAGLRCDDRDAAELKIKSEEHQVEAKIARAVAGFDLTFSAACSPTYLARLSNVPANLETAERDELATALVARHER